MCCILVILALRESACPQPAAVWFWSGEPTCPPAPRSVGSSTLASESIGPSHPLIMDHESKETLKPFEHTYPGSAAPRPTPSQSNLLLGTNTHRQVAPVPGGPTCQSVQRHCFVREQTWMGTSTNQWQAVVSPAKLFESERCRLPSTAISLPKKSREGSVPS